jgi:hypothetical protein
MRAGFFKRRLRPVRRCLCCNGAAGTFMAFALIVGVKSLLAVARA